MAETRRVLNVFQIVPGMPFKVEKWVCTGKPYEVQELQTGKKQVVLLRKGTDLLKSLHVQKRNQYKSFGITSKFFFTNE